MKRREFLKLSLGATAAASLSPEVRAQAALKEIRIGYQKTGVLVIKPEGWNGHLGDQYALDMIIGEDLNIHVDASVARITEHHIGFAYSRIPPEKEVPLWNLLGGYADRLEQFET